MKMCKKKENERKIDPKEKLISYNNDLKKSLFNFNVISSQYDLDVLLCVKIEYVNWPGRGTGKIVLIVSILHNITYFFNFPFLQTSLLKFKRTVYFSLNFSVILLKFFRCLKRVFLNTITVLLVSFLSHQLAPNFVWERGIVLLV